MVEDPVFEEGLRIRRQMFGSAGAEDQLEAATPFTRPLQEYVTRQCFGEGWTRPALDHKVRSMITLAILAAIGKPTQLRTHVRGAIANGVTVEEIREVLMHAMIYCGVPAGADAFNNAAAELDAMGAT